MDGKTIKDSSIWYSRRSYSALLGQDTALRIGIVQRVGYDATLGDVRYLVEVQNKANRILVNCRLIRRFGGVFNYEDYVYRGYTIAGRPDLTDDFQTKAGDVVVVGLLGGQGRDGIILGGLTHPGRRAMSVSDGPQYNSVFNGVQTTIDKDGAWTVTFNGQPLNLSQLANSPSKQLPTPQYDASISGSSIGFSKDGSFTVSDAAKNNPQTIKIDKAAGTLTLSSGTVSIKLSKTDKSCALTADKISASASQAWSVTSGGSASINSPKIAIGYGGVELLSEVAKLASTLASATVPSTGLMAPSGGGPVTGSTSLDSGTISALNELKSAINQIMGSLT